MALRQASLLSSSTGLSEMSWEDQKVKCPQPSTLHGIGSIKSKEPFIFMNMNSHLHVPRAAGACPLLVCLSSKQVLFGHPCQPELHAAVPICTKSGGGELGCLAAFAYWVSVSGRKPDVSKSRPLPWQMEE